MIKILFVILFAGFISSQVIASTWACIPKYWINLRIDGPEINGGNEPMFILTMTDKKIMMKGQGSWLDRSEYIIKGRYNFEGIKYFEGNTPDGSQIAFSPTNKVFFHATASSGVSVSMTGTCNKAE